MNAAEASALANTAADELRVAFAAVGTAVKIAEEQKSNVEVASNEIKKDELLAVAQQLANVVEALTDAGGVLLAAATEIEELTGRA